MTNEYEKREKRLNAFSEKLKDLSKDKLLVMRQTENTKAFSSKRRIDIIDEEFSRRKPFYSMQDKIIDESIRSTDTTKCAFYDCDDPSEYYSYLGVKNETYGLFVCSNHTKILYEPTHRKLGSIDIVKMVKKKEK